MSEFSDNLKFNSIASKLDEIKGRIQGIKNFVVIYHLNNDLRYSQHIYVEDEETAEKVSKNLELWGYESLILSVTKKASLESEY